jgi:hypothetical protein
LPAVVEWVRTVLFSMASTRSPLVWTGVPFTAVMRGGRSPLRSTPLSLGPPARTPRITRVIISDRSTWTAGRSARSTDTVRAVEFRRTAENSELLATACPSTPVMTSPRSMPASVAADPGNVFPTGTPSTTATEPMMGPKKSRKATMVMAKLLVTPAANIRVWEPRSAALRLSSLGSTKAPTGTNANSASPIDSMSMSSTRHSRP